MPLYRYKALNARGDVLEAQMEAASEAEVVARLQEQGHLPMEARLASEGGGLGAFKLLLQPNAFGGQRLVLFTQQLATLLGAGQPLDRALTILLELPDEDKARNTVADIREAVRGGAPLSTALERQHGAFSRLYINMVRAGEAGGSLHDTLQRLADYLERSRALKGRVVNALIYPAILLVVCLFVVVAPMGTVRQALSDILLITPLDLQTHVDEVARDIVARHGFLEYRSYVAKVGRGEQIELFFVARADDPPRALIEWDRLRDEIGEALGEESPDRWLTIMFTTDREWAI